MGGAGSAWCIAVNMFHGMSLLGIAMGWKCSVVEQLQGMGLYPWFCNHHHIIWCFAVAQESQVSA